MQEKVARLQKLMLSQRDSADQSVDSENIDISNLPTTFEKTNTKRETWCPSHLKRSGMIDDFKGSNFSVPPLPTEDGHAIMIAKEVELKAQISELYQRIEERDAEIQTLHKQIVENTEKAASTLDEAITRSGEQYCDMEDSLNAQIEEVTKDRDMLLDTVSALEAKVLDIEKTITSVALEKNDMSDTIETLLSDKVRLREEIGTLECTITSLTHEKSELMTTVTELTADLEAREELEQTLVLKNDALESTILEVDEKHKAEVAQLTSQISEYQETIAAMASEKDAMEAKLSEIQSDNTEIDSLQTTIQESASKVMNVTHYINSNP